MQKKNICAIGQIGIDRPFDVLNAAIVLVGCLSELGDRDDLFFAQAGRVTTLFFNLAADDAATAVGNELFVLVRNNAANHREHDLVHDVVVGGNFTRNNHFAEAPAGVDHDLGAVTGGGVDGHGNS